MSHSGDAPGVADGLAEVRRAVQRQLGDERPPRPTWIPPRFRASRRSCPTELSQSERAGLWERAEELQPWLQGPFLLGET